MPPMDALRVEREGEVLRVTLARPERHNALEPGLIEALRDAFADVGDARAVILAGEGRSFCAGADIAAMREAGGRSLEWNIEDAERLRTLLETIDECPAPVVARVQGNCLGGGCGLIACADVVFSTEDARFGFSEVRLGIVPALISPFVLAKTGPGAARRWFLTGERFDATTAERIGLVHAVADDVDAALQAVVDALLASGPEAVRAAKRLIRERPTGIATSRLNAAARTSAEGREGLSAFLEGREPAWRSSASS
jgi:methylglutaconyl-CoA hydratase